MKGGFIVTLIISVTFHALDLVLRDEATWHNFVAGVAVDMAIVAASIAASTIILTGLTAFFGTIVVATAAVPLAVVVGVGVGVTLMSLAFKNEISMLEDLIAEKLMLLEKDINNGIIKLIPKKPVLERGNCEEGFNYLRALFGIPTLNIKDSRRSMC